MSISSFFVLFPSFHRVSLMNEEWESVRPRWLEQIRMERPSVGNNGPSGRNRTDSSGRLFFSFFVFMKKNGGNWRWETNHAPRFYFRRLLFLFFLFWEGFVSFDRWRTNCVFLLFSFRSFLLRYFSLSLSIFRSDALALYRCGFENQQLPSCGFFIIIIISFPSSFLFLFNFGAFICSYCSGRLDCLWLSAIRRRWNVNARELFTEPCKTLENPLKPSKTR